MFKTKSSYYSKNRRYSNDEVTGQGSSTGIGSGWDWGQFNNTLGIIGSSLTSIFSPSSKWQNETNSQLYQQEKRTNTILWVVIGLMVALGVVLLIRKNN